jgi:hypothetical protein
VGRLPIGDLRHGRPHQHRHAPWTLVEANDKGYARVKILRTICERLEAELDGKPVPRSKTEKPPKDADKKLKKLKESKAPKEPKVVSRPELAKVPPKPAAASPAAAKVPPKPVAPRTPGPVAKKAASKKGKSAP